MRSVRRRGAKDLGWLSFPTLMLLVLPSVVLISYATPDALAPRPSTVMAPTAGTGPGGSPTVAPAPGHFAIGPGPAVNASPHWTRIATGGPPARYGEVFADDPKDGYDLMTGGWDVGTPGFLNDTWGFVHGNWTDLTSGVRPPLTYGASLTYDAADGYMVLVGGCITSLSTCPWETWTYSGGHWNVLRSKSYFPSNLEWASLAYDAKDGYVVMFGGAGSADTNATWKYLAGTWTNITPKLGPSPRYSASMTYDAKDGYLLLEGGGARLSSCSGTCPLADTWTFSGGRWTELIPTLAPSARYEGDMAYDAHLGTVVLYGGWRSFSSLNDTWTFSNGTWTNLSLKHSPPAVPYLLTTYCTASGSYVAYQTITATFVYRSVVWIFR